MRTLGKIAGLAGLDIALGMLLELGAVWLMPLVRITTKPGRFSGNVTSV